MPASTVFRRSSSETLSIYNNHSLNRSRTRIYHIYCPISTWEGGREGERGMGHGRDEGGGGRVYVCVYMRTMCVVVMLSFP